MTLNRFSKDFREEWKERKKQASGSEFFEWVVSDGYTYDIIRDNIGAIEAMEFRNYCQKYGIVGEDDEVV